MRRPVRNGPARSRGARGAFDWLIRGWLFERALSFASCAGELRAARARDAPYAVSASCAGVAPNHSNPPPATSKLASLA